MSTLTNQFSPPRVHRRGRQRKRFTGSIAGLGACNRQKASRENSQKTKTKTKTKRMTQITDWIACQHVSQP